MNFLLRGINLKDLDYIYELSQQFTLLNLLADKIVLIKKIETSINSFNQTLKKEDSEFIFVVEDIIKSKIVGGSMIISKHGTVNCPHYSYKVNKRDLFSKDIGIGFIHQVLHIDEVTDGPTEIGGLIVDREYRKLPEKIGLQISLVRFLFLGLKPELFEKNILCELTAPLNSEGKSDFWEGIGKKFTGITYQEADKLSQTHKEFIHTLFPKENLYITLLDSKVRLTLGQVGEKTKPAKHLLEKVGFKYLNEVDPFDGGPHYGAKLDDITIIKQARWSTIKGDDNLGQDTVCLMGLFEQGKFRAVQTFFKCQNEMVYVPKKILEVLNINEGDQVYFSPIS